MFILRNLTRTRWLLGDGASDLQRRPRGESDKDGEENESSSTKTMEEEMSLDEGGISGTRLGGRWRQAHNRGTNFVLAV